MTAEWRMRLARHVEKFPCAIVRLERDESDGIASSRRQFRRFTIARSHELVDRLKVPTICVSLELHPKQNHAYVGLCTHKQPITTLLSRLSFRYGFCAKPDTEKEIARLVTGKALAGLLEGALRQKDSVVQLTPKVSSAVVSALAAKSSNQRGFRIIDDVLSTPRTFSSNAALERDAVELALRAFGLTLGSEATFLAVSDDNDTSLRRVALNEDTVIEHDARSIPGLDMVASDTTGRAVFQKGDETLEVFTANKRPLEEVLGVDLVYLNLTRLNIAMVQYKMLEFEGKGNWVYRPDRQLEKEMRRMEAFTADNEPGEFEYRLNPAAFFLKFVRRDRSVDKGGYIIPIDHYKMLVEDPRARGERDGIRITYDSLDGRFLRDEAFMSLIRCGYIGPYAATTQAFADLVRFIVKSGRAVVGAIEYPTPIEPQSGAN